MTDTVVPARKRKAIIMESPNTSSNPANDASPRHGDDQPAMTVQLRGEECRLIPDGEIKRLTSVVEDHLDELTFATFVPGEGMTTEDGEITVKAKTVTGQMGRHDPMVKLTTFMTVKGVDMKLDVYMNFDVDSGEWVVDAHQVTVDHKQG